MKKMIFFLTIAFLALSTTSHALGEESSVPGLRSNAEIVKELAVKLWHKEKGEDIKFEELYELIFINPNVTVLTYNGLVGDNKKKIITIAFCCAWDGLPNYSLIMWDDLNEYIRESSSRERLANIFQKRGFDLGPIEESPHPYPALQKLIDELKGLSKMHKDELISEAESDLSKINF
jgi:hypothetical protein